MAIFLLFFSREDVLIGGVIDGDDGAAVVDDQEAVGPNSKAPVGQRVDDGAGKDVRTFGERHLERWIKIVFPDHSMKFY